MKYLLALVAIIEYCAAQLPTMQLWKTYGATVFYNINFLEDYQLEFCVAQLPTNCGKPTVQPSRRQTSFIVGGKSAVPYSWPWQVAVFKRTFISSSLRCGGTLVNNQWILTAAHCVFDDQTLSKYSIKLGVFNQNSNDEDGEQVQNIIKIQVNPNYNSQNQSNDIALLKLSYPVIYNDHISPVCLPQQNDNLPAVGTKLVATGWGATTQAGVYSAALQEVVVPLVDPTICNTDYPQRVDNSNMFCAGYAQGGKDACQGDSGGPLVYLDMNSNKFFQLGIVSWGEGCGQPNKPGVYSKVSNFVTWITSVVSQ